MLVRRFLFAILILSSPVLAQNPIGPVSGGIPAAVNTALAKKIDKKTLAQLGSTKQVYIWYRTDGVAGIGTQSEPFDGSTQAKFDALFTSLQGITGLTIHLGPAPSTAPFQTNVATKPWFVKNGWKIIGSGMYQTYVQAIGNMHLINYGISVFFSDPSVSTNNIIISDLTVDNNSTLLSSTADTGSGGEKNYKSAAINLFGSNNTVERVRSINSYGSLANLQERFDIAISSPNTITTSGNTIRFCRAETPLGNYGSPFAIFGASGHLQSGSSVHDCEAFGVNNGLNAGFTTGGVNGAWLLDCQFYNNYFQDCQSAYYQDTGTAERIRIEGNTLVRGQLGIAFLADGSGAWTKQDISITGNNLLMQNRDAGNAVVGIIVGNAATNTLLIADNIVRYSITGSGMSGGGQPIEVTSITNLTITGNTLDQMSGTATVASSTNIRKAGNRDQGGATITGLIDTDVAAVNSAAVDAAFGSTRGSVLIRGVSGWTILAPGTTGYALSSNGVGADPSYQVVGGSGTVANPSALVGLAAINGSNTSAIRSDGAPALDQSISPVWTGQHTFSLTDATTNTIPMLTAFRHNTSGTPANGFGATNNYFLQSSTTINRFAFGQRWYWTDATDATRSSAYKISLENSGSGSASDVFFLFGDGGGSLNANVDPGAGIWNVNTGFRIGNAATSAHFLRGNGTNYVDSAIQAGDIPDISATYMTPAGAYSVTNKTFDASAAGNVLKRSEYIQLGFPDNGDGTNAVRVTTEGPTFGHYTFKAGVAKASNYVVYRIRVPDDLDTTVDLAAAFKFRLGGADTGTHSYYISMANVASSSSADSPTFSNEVAISFAGDASGASGDIEHVTYVTLTSWKASLTPGQTLVIKLARDGTDGSLDSSTVDSTDLNLAVRYGSSQ